VSISGIHRCTCALAATARATEERNGLFHLSILHKTPATTALSGMPVTLRESGAVLSGRGNMAS